MRIYFFPYSIQDITLQISTSFYFIRIFRYSSFLWDCLFSLFEYMMRQRTMGSREGTQIRIIVIEDIMMTMLLAIMFVEKGYWSDIVQESEVRAQIRRDLLLGCSCFQSSMLGYEMQCQSQFIIMLLFRLWQMRDDSSRFASAKQYDLKQSPKAKRAVMTAIVMTCEGWYIAKLMYVLRQQLQQLERKVTAMSEMMKMMCLWEW